MAQPFSRSELSAYQRAHPLQRKGQAAFNLLSEKAPDLASRVAGIKYVDPFYNDANLSAFFQWIEEQWEEK